MCETSKTCELAEGADSAEPTSSPAMGSPGFWTPNPTFHSFMNSKTRFDDIVLFVDQTFPMPNIQPGVVWRRPKEICPSAQFIIDGATRLDVCQGKLSDCWFLSAVASLSLHRPLLERVVPMEQSFQFGYTGCFVFRFWQYGAWVDVKIDDFLPTMNGELLYLRSSKKKKEEKKEKEEEEFWCCLLEKAYAKLKGGYQALNMGFPHEAMVDLTGGVTEMINVSTLPRDVRGFLEPLLRKGALINCANSQGPMEQKNSFGILFRHAYSVTGLETVKTITGAVDLVRVLNPWGNTEWDGPWSENRPEWNQVSLKEQQRVNRNQTEDGEFWITLPDFCLNFDIIEVCHQTEDTLSKPGTIRRPWQCAMHHENWVQNLTAGGPPGGASYWQNPQFLLTLLEEDDDPNDPELTCSFLVALMQKHQRRSGIHLSISLHIFKAWTGHTYLSQMDLALLSPVLSLEQPTPRTEVVIRGSLAPGNYIIIPSTSEANQEGEFLLRVLTEKGNKTTASEKPSPEIFTQLQPSSPTLLVLPRSEAVQRIFNKHCNNKGQCRPAELLSLLREAFGSGVLAGCVGVLCLEHCKSFVALMDNKGIGQLDWLQFQALWENFRKWTDIFMKFDRNKSQSLEYTEIFPALKAAGVQVDEFLIQLIGLRYTEPDMTVSYPGFLSLLLKLSCMIHKFQAFDVMGMGNVSLSYRQWLHLTMYN